MVYKYIYHSLGLSVGLVDIHGDFRIRKKVLKNSERGWREKLVWLFADAHGQAFPYTLIL